MTNTSTIFLGHSMRRATHGSRCRNATKVRLFERKHMCCHCCVAMRGVICDSNHSKVAKSTCLRTLGSRLQPCTFVVHFMLIFLRLSYPQCSSTSPKTLRRFHSCRPSTRNRRLLGHAWIRWCRPMRTFPTCASKPKE